MPSVSRCPRLQFLEAKSCDSLSSTIITTPLVDCRVLASRILQIPAPYHRKRSKQLLFLVIWHRGQVSFTLVRSRTINISHRSRPSGYLSRNCGVRCERGPKWQESIDTRHLHRWCVAQANARSQGFLTVKYLTESNRPVHAGP